jgi:hypothetical protein
MSATTRFSHRLLPEPPALYLAFELSNRSWKLAFSTGLGQKARIRSIPARDPRGPRPRDRRSEASLHARRLRPAHLLL